MVATLRGKAVFESDRAGCTKCHAFKGVERRAGPDLGVVGDKFGASNWSRPY